MTTLKRLPPQKSIFAFALTCALIMMSGCGPEPTFIAIDPPAPVPSIRTELVSRTESNIGLQFDIPHERIKQLVEQGVPMRIDSNGAIKQELTRLVLDDYYKYWFERKEMNISLHDNTVEVAVPLKGQIECGGNISLLWGSITKHVQETADIEGTLRAKVALSMTNDYDLTAAPTIDLDLNKAEITIDLPRPIPDATIGIKTLIHDEFKKIAPKIAEEALSKAVKELAIRKRIDSAWNELHTVRTLSEQPKVWLIIDPTEIRLRPLNFSPNPVPVAASVAAHTIVRVQEQNPTPRNKPLPGLVLDPNLINKISLRLPIQASLAPISNELNTKVAGQKSEFKNFGFKIEYKSARLETSGDRVICAIDLEAKHEKSKQSASGTIFATGILRYDPSTETASIRDFDLDLATRNFLLSKVSWLVIDTVLEPIKKDLKFNIRPLLDIAKAKANEELTKNNIDTPFKLNVKIESLSVEDLTIANSQAFVLVNAEGTAQANLQ